MVASERPAARTSLPPFIAALLFSTSAASRSDDAPCTDHTHA